MAILASLLGKAREFFEELSEVPLTAPCYPLLVQLQEHWLAGYTPFLPYFGVKRPGRAALLLSLAMISRPFLEQD